MPDWLRQLGTGSLDQAASSTESADSDTPDWLSQLQATAPTLESTPAADTPDWLAELQRTTGPLPATDAPPPRKIEVDADRATVERLVEAFSASEAQPAGSVEPDTAEVEFTEATSAESSSLLADAAHEVGKAGAGLVLGGAALAGAAASGLAGLVKGENEKPVEDVAATGSVEPEPMASEEPEPATMEAAAILEGDISPEDALAFFARLSAGKEDQLRAEAEAEGESRMATIMGRPSTAPLAAETPIEPAQSVEAVIEPVAEVAVPEAIVPEEPEPATMEAAAILEGDVSPEDALAFFARLSAGKEDQLRAEAEAEGESRMATIMGRQPTSPLPGETPVESVIEPVAEMAVTESVVSEEPEPATVEAAAILEGDVSPEDALAFFARLSAGKEDQLRAEAEAEGESRMATIMGRPSTAPLAAETPIEPAQPAEAVIEPAAEVLRPSRSCLKNQNRPRWKPPRSLKATSAPMMPWRSSPA